jgi:hypothetical protein
MDPIIDALKLNSSAFLKLPPSLKDPIYFPVYLKANPNVLQHMDIPSLSPPLLTLALSK